MQWLARAAVVLALPLVVGALGSRLLSPQRRAGYRAAVALPALRHLPLLALVGALDFAALMAGVGLGWARLEPGAGLASPLWVAALALALPFAGFVSVVGWEWGLRARLYAVWAEHGDGFAAAGASVVCGVALGLVQVLPGLAISDPGFVVCGLVGIAAREATALRLFRRAGVLLSGTYRMLAIGFDGLLIADRLAWGSAALETVAVDPRFYALRAAGPLAAALAAWILAARLDRRGSSPDFSPAFCCGAASAPVCCVALGRPARRTERYVCAGLGRDALQPRAAATPRDERW